ncbi:MAG: BrnT family toxin [Treponema sp.]|nr:BrnT family toxin [Treponema sp.]
MVFGMVDKVLFVAFTKREADRIRIISARPA